MVQQKDVLLRFHDALLRYSDAELVRAKDGWVNAQVRLAVSTL